jgi:phosphatidylserine/phosphatidylglycerophosphate/cardiolipin synthase-like enzyme
MPTTGVIVGGSWMLEQFFQDVVTLKGGLLAIAVPFIDEGIAELATCWEAMSHKEIDLVLVTGIAGSRYAWNGLRQYPWRSLLICRNRNLHAKVYSFLSGRHYGTCLIGSHNLTSRALNANLEAGVLLRLQPNTPDMQAPVLACQEYVLDLAKKSKAFVDTTSWPELVESEQRNGGSNE